jgi:hypothetical protein
MMVYERLSEPGNMLSAFYEERFQGIVEQGTRADRPESVSATLYYHPSTTEHIGPLCFVLSSAHHI